MDMISKNIVIEYLDWIETNRNCSVPTRKVRLAAIRSFTHYLQYQNRDNLLEWQGILSIPVKKAEKKTINYLTLNGIKLPLEMPDQKTTNGRRDLILLAVMYDTGVRVQELVDLTPFQI